MSAEPYCPEPPAEPVYVPLPGACPRCLYPLLAGRCAMCERQKRAASGTLARSGGGQG